MSLTETSPPPSITTRPRARSSSVGLWVRVALVCAVLIGSGVVRSRQSRRIEGQIARGLTESFPLDTLPMTLGDWTGESTTLDEQIARGTGAKQIVTRRYVNKSTGVSLEVILLFGQAVDIYIHSPELCYPAAGFALVSGPDTRLIETSEGKAPFRSLVYGQGNGANSLQEVYYSWRYNGRWTPEAGPRKHFERISGMYKVHIARRTTETEKRYEGNPSEAFLAKLLPEMERRMAEASTPPP
jgi:EpsI family protein